MFFFNIPLRAKTLYETKHQAKWNLLHTSPAQCSLLHCSLMDLTLANSLSVIYDQTAPEPGIYYPLLLSIRQHYITLHCSSQFAEQQCITRKKYAVKIQFNICKTSSSFAGSEHVCCKCFFSFSGLLKGLLREKGRYILIYMNHLLPPTFHFLHTLHLITEKKSFVSLKLYTVNLSFIFSLPQSTLMFRFLGVFKVLCKNLSNQAKLSSLSFCLQM